MCLIKHCVVLERERCSFLCNLFATNKTWNSSIYFKRTKIKLFNALVQPVVLFGSQTWKIMEGDNKKIDEFQSKCLRRIYKVHWPYIISNDELLKRGQTQRWSEVVRQKRWSWIRHVLRMDHSSHCATDLTWTPEGTRKVGRLKTTWRRTVEKEREQLGQTSWSQARMQAQNRSNWHRCIKALCASGHEEGRWRWMCLIMSGTHSDGCSWKGAQNFCRYNAGICIEPRRLNVGSLNYAFMHEHDFVHNCTSHI